ncbi:MAG: thiamine pyrophosphate-dependent enzyme [Candidatus Shapirobacteria bacterium]|jgi:2-oxoglutarate ferredoxin oxidoreductase subunit beta
MIDDLRSKVVPTWCPGCHNHLLSTALNLAIKKLRIAKKDLVLVYDIGCIGNMADFFSTYSIHGLHGRCIPTALGVKMFNPKLTVIAIGGDGGIYGEGMGHLIATARANSNLTVLVSNNNLYSLTTGQTSPTTPRGSKTKSTPLGSVSAPVEPLALLSAANSEVFAASAEGQNIQSLTDTIVAAINHPGFSLVDIRQTCVTFGKQLLS